MPISELWTLPYVYKQALPDFQNGQDIKFPDTLVEALLKRFTKEKDKVLDPFSGLGTTLFACERMNRIPYGIETDKTRHDWVKKQIESKNNLFLDDAANVTSLNLPKIDFCLTSPPYMPHHHKWNPLYNGDPKYAGYDRYLNRIQYIYQQISTIMKRNAYLVVQADNLTNKQFSPLIWDLGKAISNVLSLEGEIMITWSKNIENNNPFTQCLVFKKK